VKRLIVERNRYFDSVFLMRISSELEKLDDVTQAVVAMATPVNLENLIKSGFELGAEKAPLQPSDLIIAIDAETDDAMTLARDRLEELLTGGGGDESSARSTRPSSLDEALAADPEANLVLISVPGAHAAREARQALRRGLHVMLFSDNVTVDDEIALKDEAVKRGLLMMGPDCGTAILNNAALGFANACRPGGIGIVGASGTGIQEISSLVHQLGGGISQAIGTGGRDLSEAVSGRMTRFGIEALGSDPGTEVIVVVSKTPSPAVADKVIQTLASTGKPSVVHFIGGQATQLSENMEATATLADAALAAVAKSAIDPKISSGAPTTVSPLGETVTNRPSIGRAVGLYCGGTLCQETWNILHQAGLEVRSNVAGEAAKKIHPDADETGHVVWDLGDDAFTVGKPHPMIEPGLRDERVAQAGEDPSVGIVLADCVIGYGAHENPAESLAGAAIRAFAGAKKNGRSLVVLASVTGTDQDPQNLHRQQKILEAAGIIVAPSNAAAARAAADLMKGNLS